MSSHQLFEVDPRRIDFLAGEAEEAQEEQPEASEVGDPAKSKWFALAFAFTASCLVMAVAVW